MDVALAHRALTPVYKLMMARSQLRRAQAVLAYVRSEPHLRNDVRYAERVVCSCLDLVWHRQLMVGLS